MADVTMLLAAVRAGEGDAAERLLALVYGELNQLAAAQLAGEAPGRTLSATALVHEAYLRLAGSEGNLTFENRRHFFGAAAQAMRRILVDGARRRGRAKRGGDAARIVLSDVAAPDDSSLGDERLAALDDALRALAAVDAEAAEVVDLHHFAGLSYEQAADALGTSVYHVRQKWAFARAWLQDALK